MYFADESLGQGSIGRKFDCFHDSHKMPVMIIVAVVIAKHAAVVRCAPSQIDVGETVGNYLFAFKPYLLFQERTLSLSLEPVCLTRRLNRRFLLRHNSHSSTEGMCKILPARGRGGDTAA